MRPIPYEPVAQRPRSTRRSSVHMALLAATTAAGLALGYLAAPLLAPARDGAEPGVLWPSPQPLTPFALAATDGNTLTPAALRGKWTFMVFGYTHCPDVCPATLAALDRAESLLAKDALPARQYVFVSVDPARDDLPRMADYVAYFNPAFIGATGNDAALTALREQLGVYASAARATDPADYSVDHTTAVYLIDPQARLFAALPMPHDGPTLAARFRDLVLRSRQPAVAVPGVQTGS